jgi:hypothetical protein
MFTMLSIAQVQGDPLLLGLMLSFFAYVIYLFAKRL